MGEENCEVHCRGPFGRVSLDVELATGTIDFTDNSLDGHHCSGEGFLVLVELDHVPFAIVTGALCGLFWHWGHKSCGGDIVILWLGSSDLGFGCSCGGGKGDLSGLVGVMRCGASSRGFNLGVFDLSNWGVDGMLFLGRGFNVVCWSLFSSFMYGWTG